MQTCVYPFVFTRQEEKFHAVGKTIGCVRREGCAGRRGTCSGQVEV
jgi:hypothetical protein